jgi:hypothetical protein
VRLEFGKVDVDNLVVLGVLVGLEAEAGVFARAATGEALQSLDVLDSLTSAGRLEVSG